MVYAHYGDFNIRLFILSSQRVHNLLAYLLVIKGLFFFIFCFEFSTSLVLLIILKKIKISSTVN